jgi:predicted secreted protein
MTQYHGKSTAFKLDDTGGTLRDISAYCDEVSIKRENSTAETTTFGDTSRDYLGGLMDATISVSGKWDDAATTGVDVVVGQDLNAVATRSIEYGPSGTTTGRVKYTGECIITSFEITGNFDDVVTFSMELQTTGGVTRTTW